MNCSAASVSFDTQGDVAEQFAVEPFLDLPRSDELAVDARERRRVDAKDHRDRRLVDVDDRQRLRIIDERDRFADLDIVKSGKRDDLACPGLVDGRPFEAFENEKLFDARLLRSSRRVLATATS